MKTERMKELEELQERMDALEAKMDEILSLLQNINATQWAIFLNRNMTITLDIPSEEAKAPRYYKMPTETDGGIKQWHL